MSDTRDASDEELLEAARVGDERAFRVLVDRHHESLARTVAGMLGPGDTIDDVLQEVFVQFYKNLSVFRGDSSVKTYLNRIAVNRSLDVLRRRRRRFKRFVGLDEAGAGDLVSDSSDPSAGADETVWKALDRLSDDQRAVVSLRLVDGYSTQETAEILGVRYGTVLSRLSRASENLRAMLQPAYGEEDKSK